MKKKNKVILLFVLAIGLVLTACSKNSKEADSSNGVSTKAAQSSEADSAGQENSATAEGTKAAEKDLKPFKIGLASQLDVPTGVLGLAVQNGYLDEELASVGYKPEFIGFAQAGPAVNEAFVSKDIDAALYGDFPAVVLKSKGINVSVVGIADAQSNLSIAVAKDSDIAAPKDLEGKKVLVSIGTVYEQYWGRVVEEYGLDESKVEIINDPANALQTFVSGNADALVSADIYNVIASAQYPVKLIDSTKQDHPDWGFQLVISARDEFSEEHPEVTTALLKGYIRAYNDIVAEPALLVESNVVEGSIPVEVAQAIYGDVDIELYDGDIGEINISKLQQLNDFLLNKELTSTSVDIKTLVNTSFYEAAKAAVESGK